MPTQRDPDAHTQARQERDPDAPDHHLPPHQQPYWLTVDDPTSLDPAALGALLLTLPDDDPRYIAARLAVEVRTERAATRAAGLDVHAALTEHDLAAFDGHPDHAEIERRRSTFHGRYDPHHHALRADPDHGRGAA